jgi:integrase
LDPAQAKRERREADTFAEVCDDFLRLHAEPKLRPESVRQARRIIERELKPLWGPLKAQDVRRRDVIDLIDGIAIERGHRVLANRVRATVSSIFTFALRREVVEASPCMGLPEKFAERPRERTLTDDEIREFWRSTGEEAPVIRDLFRLLLLLGQRSGETRAMVWEHIRDNLWYIPAGLTKNNQEQVVPLPAIALHILLQHQRDGRTGVFVTRGSRPVQFIQKAKARIAARMGRGDWTAHDLRRTCASGLERLGVSEAVIASVLNHSKAARQGVTAVYVRHRFLDEKREALERWARHVMSVCELDPSGAGA